MESIMKKSSEGIDKYRGSFHLDYPNVQWRHGKPPTYETFNHLFELGKTKEWVKGSLEETVQKLVKLWHMEVYNLTSLLDFKTINPEKFKLFVNGREGLSGEEIVKIGSFNAMLKSSVPEEFQYFNTEKEKIESSHQEFKTCFPRGFAWEVMEVYSGPPLIALKFRHWGFFEGPFKGHSPTAEMVQFFGLVTLKVDPLMKVEEVHVYYDPGELFGALLKGKKTTRNDKDSAASDASACPFSQLKN